MKLYRHHRQLSVAQSFDRSVVQIDQPNLPTLVFRQTRGIDFESMILGSNRHLSGQQILHGLIPAAMTEFELTCRSAD